MRHSYFEEPVICGLHLSTVCATSELDTCISNRAAFGVKHNTSDSCSAITAAQCDGNNERADVDLFFDAECKRLV